MESSDNSEIILANLLNASIDEVSKIPPELQLVLISKFDSMRREIELKRSEETSHEDTTSKSNIPSTECTSADLESSHFHHHSSQTTTEAEADFFIGFPTAADALASEAAFMENIGLYLNPKPALSKSHGNKTPNPRNDHHTSEPDAIENDLLFLVEEGGGQSSTVVTESTSKSRHQSSLLSFLNKAKHLTSEEELENKCKDQMDPLVGEASSSVSLRGNWKLWTDQNGPDIWDDLFSSIQGESKVSETSSLDFLELFRNWFNLGFWTKKISSS